MSSLKKLVIRGTLWTIIGYGASQSLRFFSNLILTHLLVPEFFGLMALVNIFVIGLGLFSDFGIGISIIQNKDGDTPAFANTAWTIKVIRGFGIWLICALIAYPIAQLYHEPQMMWLIPVAGLTAIIDGFTCTALMSLERRMAISQITLIELAKQVIQIGVMLGLALIYPSVWALVIGGLVSDVFRLIWSYKLIPGYSNRFQWDPSAAQEIFSLGRWIFMATALAFSAEQIDRLLLGKIFSLELLGIYSIALTLSDLPRQVMIALSMRVLFPAISKFVDLPRSDYRTKILHHRRLFLYALVLGMTLMIGFGDLAISVLYDARYLPATWMFPILAIGIWPRIVCTTIEPALTALGKVQYATIGNLMRLIFTVVGILIGFAWFGNLGAIVAVSLNDLVYYAAMSYGCWREGVNGWKQDLTATLLLILGVTAIVMLRLSIGLSLPWDKIA